MTFIEDDHVIEALSTNGSDQALDKWILPGAQGARDDLADAHPGDAPSEDLAVDCVAVPHEPVRGGVIREGLDDLLGRPRSRGMFRDGDVDDPSVRVPEILTA
jgi:hypothetical protein